MFHAPYTVMKRWLIDDNKWVITVHAASLRLQMWLSQQANWFSAKKQLIIERVLSETWLIYKEHCSKSLLMQLFTWSELLWNIMKERSLIISVAYCMLADIVWSRNKNLLGSFHNQAAHQEKNPINGIIVFLMKSIGRDK